MNFRTVAISIRSRFVRLTVVRLCGTVRPSMLVFPAIVRTMLVLSRDTFRPPQGPNCADFGEPRICGKLLKMEGIAVAVLRVDSGHESKFLSILPPDLTPLFCRICLRLPKTSVCLKKRTKTVMAYLNDYQTVLAYSAKS